MTQAERLQDKRTNPAAKQLAAMDAAIDARYGRGSSAAARMRAAAREAVAQTLERGKPIRAPRVHEIERHAEHRRDDARLQRDAARQRRMPGSREPVQNKSPLRLGNGPEKVEAPTMVTFGSRGPPS